MARRVIGLDLGAYSVKLVRLVSGKQNSKFEIINSIEEILPVDEERDLFERQKDALAKFSQMGLLEAETCAIGLEAAAGQMLSMQVPFLDNRKLEAVLPGLLEVEVPFEVDDMVVSWHRSQEYYKNLAPAEKPEFTHIRVAFGKKPVIAKTLQMLQGFSINPRLVLLSSVASFELVRELKTDVLFTNNDQEQKPLSAIIDFGHRATNLCIFDRKGLSYSRSFLRGGKKLSEDIAKTLAIPFKEAEALKHEKMNLSHANEGDVNKELFNLAINHHQELLDDIIRTLILVKTSGIGDVKSIAFIGGASRANGFLPFFLRGLKEQEVAIVPAEALVPEKISSPSMVLSFSYALSCMQLHAKESRFNFRKDEFTWRGDLDFLRTKSTPLTLWALVLICSLTVMWWANALVLDKENQHIEHQLKTVCSEILGQKNIAPKKCLAQMKEQISANIDIGIPEFSASDVYVKAAELLPKEPKVVFSELDVTEKKVRITGKTGSFEDVDKIVANITKIPCFFNVEKGRAQQVDSGVEFHLSSDVNCSAAREKNKAKS